VDFSWLNSLWSTADSFFNQIGVFVTACWTTILTWFAGAALWLFYTLPADLLSWGESLVHVLFHFAYLLLPSSLQHVLDGMSSFFSGPFLTLANVGLYLISPIIDSWAVVGCVTVATTVWAVSLIIRGVFLVKNHVWSAGS
jgi:hypothetical protein